MTTHEITLDEAAPITRLDDVAFRAFCTCGWASDWQHADQQATRPDECSAGLAQDLAEFQGDDHLDETDPAPDPRLFKALRIPATDQNGYAR